MKGTGGFAPVLMAALDKSSWRRELAARRSALTLQARRRAAIAITASALSLPAVRTARIIGLYADIRDEVPTARLALLLCSMGKKIALPNSDPATGLLSFRLVGRAGQLKRGNYGIPEPVPSAAPVEPSSIDAVFVPGVGFDRRGYRLGYGAGYYDRFLPLLRPDCVRIGIAFACQIVPELPHGPFDQQMDAIVTEDGVIACPGRIRHPG